MLEVLGEHMFDENLLIENDEANAIGGPFQSDIIFRFLNKKTNYIEDVGDLL